MVVSDEISAALSAVNWACDRATIAVRTARPSAADVRCTTLLNALARLTIAGGTAAMPPVMIGIIGDAHAERAQGEEPDMCSCEVSRVSIVQLVGAPRDDRQPDHGGPARAEAVVHAAGDRHAHRHDQRLRQQEQAGLEGAEPVGLLQVAAGCRTAR